MTFTPKEGMICVTRNGQKVGPLLYDRTISMWPFEAKIDGKHMAMGTRVAWRSDGTFDPSSRAAHPLDLVAEWTDEPALPVRTRTVTEIVPGTYGSIMVSEPGDYAVFIRMHIEDHGKFMDAAQLRAAARLFVSLAEALETTS